MPSAQWVGGFFVFGRCDGLHRICTSRTQGRVGRQPTVNLSSFTCCYISKREGYTIVPKTMPQTPAQHVSQRSEWPAMLERAAGLAAQGASRTTAGNIIQSEFSISETAFASACLRGEVPHYPSTDKAREAAWATGRTRYVRHKPCRACGGNEFLTSDGRCTACEDGWKRDYYTDAP